MELHQQAAQHGAMLGEQAEETRKAWSYLMPAQIHLGKAAFANLGANVELSYGTSARLPGPRGGGRLLWARHGFLLVLSMAGRLSSSVVALRPIRFGRRRPQMRSSCNRWDGEQLREPSSDRRHENEAERSGGMIINRIEGARYGAELPSLG
jgi:hypothetical protein